MNIFPTQYSTLSAKAINLKLMDSYGLQGTTCKLLIRNVSDTYILESPGARYIFKIYRDVHRKLEEIQGEIELLNILVEKGAQVSYPIKDLKGSQIQTFNAAEGTRYGVLFSWAPGKVVYNMNNAQLETVGREMAAIHNITSAVVLKHQRKTYTVNSTIIDPIKVIEPAFGDDLKEEYDYLKTTAAYVIDQLEQLSQTNFSYGYCHYDFFPKNFHFAEDGRVTFFDFDFAGKGFLINDITSFFIHYFLEVTYGKITEAEGRHAFQTFVQHYRKVRALTDEELRAIPYFGFAFWVFYLGFQYEHFDDWSNIFFGPKFIKERVALIKKWMDLSGSLLLQQS